MFVSSNNDVRILIGLRALPVATSLDNISSENIASNIRGTLFNALNTPSNIYAEYFEYKYHLVVDGKKFVYDIRNNAYLVGPRFDIIATVRDEVTKGTDRAAPYALSYQIFKNSTKIKEEISVIHFGILLPDKVTKMIYAEESHIQRTDKNSQGNFLYDPRPSIFRYIVSNGMSQSQNGCINAAEIRDNQGTGGYRPFQIQRNSRNTLS